MTKTKLFRCITGTHTLIPTDFEMLRLNISRPRPGFFKFAWRQTAYVTWPFNLQCALTYVLCWHHRLSCSVFELLSHNCFGVVTLTSQGQVTSFVTWLFHSLKAYIISC